MQNGDEAVIGAPTLAENETKRTIRLKVWRHMQANKVSLFPRPIYNRVPNFKGSVEAAERLAEMDVFKNAQVIKVNSNKPQERVRVAVLEQNKKLYVSAGRQKGYLSVMEAPEEKKGINRLVTKRGMEASSKLIEIDELVELDILVIGSVAVSKDGYHIGQGRGFDDLEFGVLMHLKAIKPSTLVVTTVHDCQVFESLPADIFGPHDVPVDIIVTPTKIIETQRMCQRPTGLIWNLLTHRRLEHMPIINIIRDMEMLAGRPCELRDPAPTHSPVARRRKTRKDKSDKEESDKPEAERKTRRPKAEIDFSIKVSNITTNTRVRDVKKSLAELGVKPQIMSWKGFRGFCYLHYLKPNPNKGSGDAEHSLQSVLEALKDMQINSEEGGEYKPLVEAAPPRKSKNEVRVDSEGQTTV